jgi:hypothetical protein
MLKTLRITSVIAAVLAAGLFAFPVVFGFRSDENIEQFLASQSVVDEFRQNKGSRAQRGEGQISPLVEQANAFALYLNPPAPVVVKEAPRPPRPPKDPEKAPPPPPPRPPRTTPKFKVVLTSFYEARPEMSLALIDEVGEGRHWVREGTQVGHVTVERIKDGVVTARGGQEIFELAVPIKEEISLLADAAPVSAAVSLPTLPEPTPTVDSSEVAAPAPTPADVAVRKAPAVSSEEAAALVALVDKLKAAQSGTGEGEAASPKGKDDRAALMEQFMSALNAKQSGAENVGSAQEDQKSQAPVDEPVPEPEDARIGREEAKRLGDLGQDLKDGRQGSNRAKLRREQLMKERRERMKRRMEERMKKTEASAEESPPAE